MKKIFTISMLSVSLFFPVATYAQDVENIEITQIEPTKIEESNKKIIQDSVGAVAGAAVGYGISHYFTNYGTVGKSVISIGAGAAGAYVADKYGSDALVDAVKITYTCNSVKNNIVVKGDIKNYHLGKAFIVDSDGSKKVYQQPDKQS